MDDLFGLASSSEEGLGRSDDDLGLGPSSLTFCPFRRVKLISMSLGSVSAVKIVTWLILPVVICLSQRLSHACLSISNLYRETANGSLNLCFNGIDGHCIVVRC